MGLFRRTRASQDTATVVETGAAPMTVIATVTPTLNVEDTGPDRDDESDVFVCKRDARVEPEADASVTLIITGWLEVQPGPLAWPFPSMRSALDAVRKMKNAVEWSIVLGKDYATIEEARANGALLIEQRS